MALRRVPFVYVSEIIKEMRENCSHKSKMNIQCFVKWKQMNIIIQGIEGLFVITLKSYWIVFWIVSMHATETT